MKNHNNIRAMKATIYLSLAVTGLHTMQASLTIAESFDPPQKIAGAEINGVGGGFGFGSNNWEDMGDFIQFPKLVASEGLSYPGLQSSGLAMQSQSGGGVRRQFDPIIATTTGQETWVSFLMQVPGEPIDGGNPFDSVALFLENSTGGGSSVGFGAFFDPDFESSYFGIFDLAIGESDPDEIDFSPYAYAPSFQLERDYIYLVLGQIIWNMDGLETVNLYLNPDLSIGLNDPIATNEVDLEFNGVHQILRLGFVLGGPGVVGVVDEIRIGSSFDSVTPVPEPGSVALLALALGWGMARRRRS